MKAILTLLAFLAAAPAWAKWDYCYVGTPPAGVSEYPDMPPRTFGFEIAAVPYIFKRMCGLPHEDEALHVMRIVEDYLQCSPESDLARDVRRGLTQSDRDMSATYYTDLPRAGFKWNQLCLAAASATVENMAFADRWYYDSARPEDDQVRMEDLLQALDAWRGTD